MERMAPLSRKRKTAFGGLFGRGLRMAAGHDHYFTEKPSSECRQGTIRYSLPGGQLLTLATGSGVFSKRGVDFGSDLLIRALPALRGRVLDMGCGYGAIGIAAALMNPDADVWMADVNERAIELCRQNWLNCTLGREGEAERRVILSDGFSRISGHFDSITLNPPIRSGKARVYMLLAACHERLAPGGALYTVIQKKQGKDSASAELSRLFGNCDDIARKAGYHVLRATRDAKMGVSSGSGGSNGNDGCSGNDRDSGNGVSGGNGGGGGSGG